MSAQCSFIHWNLCIRMYVLHIAAQPDKPHTPWIWTEYAYFTTKVKRTHFSKIWPFLSHVCCFDILCISRCVASHLFIHSYIHVHIYILSTWKRLARFTPNSYCVWVFFSSSLCVRFKLVRCIIIKSLHHFMEFFNRIIIENVFQSNVLCIFCVKQITNNHHFCSNSTLYLLFPVFIASSIVFSRSHSLFLSLSLKFHVNAMH